MSITTTLERWLRPGHAGSRPAVSTSQEHAGGSALGEGEFAAVDLDALLATHAALIERIRIAYGGEEGGFEAQLAPLIRRFAGLVHLLPVTREAHFRDAGGSLRCGLEVGFHALQAADGQIFSALGTVPARRAAAPRWRAAAFAMGLCCEAHRPLFGTAVHAQDGAAWYPLRMPLVEWLQEGCREHYFVHWSGASNPQRAATLAILPQLLGTSLVAFLAQPDRTILDHVVAALAAPPGTGSSALGTIVEQTLSRVVARDLRRASIPPRDLPTALVAEPIVSDDLLLPERTRASSAHAIDTSPQESSADIATSDGARPPALEHVGHVDGTRRTGEPSAPLPETPSPPRTPRRRLAVPATLNPVVADALAALLAPPSGEALAVGIDISEEGIYVPLAVWDECGLDTGLVVRALHDARLLVLQGARKVWRKRCGEADVPGLMLNARLLA
jgi:hypothetical protein